MIETSSKRVRPEGQVTRVEALLEQVKRLSTEERQELATKLRRSVTTGRSRRPTGAGPYASLLELAGTAASDFRDVSRKKKKHLGAIYGRRRT